LLVTGLAVAGATGTVAADPEVGASGNCDDGGDDRDYVAGGGYGGKLGTDGGDQPEFGGLFSGLANLVQERAVPESEDMCDGLGDSEDGDDYFEAHAEGEDQGVQYCYSDRNDDGGGEVNRKGDDGYRSDDCAYDDEGEH
jgi:hypothetical protein